MPFSIGNIASNSSITTTSGTVTISLSAGSVLLIDIFGAMTNAFGGPFAVNSVQSANLSFARRAFQTRHDNGVNDTFFCRSETWWAFAPVSLTNQVITINLSAAPNAQTDGAVVSAVECKGLLNASTPWDGNPAVPNYNNGQGNVPQTSFPGISTVSAAPVGLILAQSAGLTAGQPTGPGTWTQANAVEGTSTTVPRLFRYFQQFAAAQFNATWSGTGNDASDWLWTADAFGTPLPNVGSRSVDLDQGGTSRQWVNDYLGPTVGWVRRPTQNVLPITAAGTYTLDASTSLVTVSTSGTVVIVLPAATLPTVPGGAQPGLFVQNPITIVDIGGNAQAHPITIQPASGSENIMSLTQIQITVNFGGYTLAPNSTLRGWNSISP